MNDSYRKWLARFRVESRRAYDALMKVYPFTLDDLPDEEWLPVPDYPAYHVSNFGRVKSLKGRWGKSRILKPAFNPHGYLCTQLCKQKKIKPFRIHRLVALAFIPNPEGKPEVNHIDGHTMNNHVSNLEWVTPSENARHAYSIGLKPSGEKHFKAKLTNEQVLFIRENPLGLTQPQLAEMFGVAQVSISDIQLGKLYKQAGGIIHSKRQGGMPRVPDDIREQIRAEYQKGVKGCGSHALAKKYGLVHSTVLNIIHESQ